MAPATPVDPAPPRPAPPPESIPASAPVPAQSLSPPDRSNVMYESPSPSPPSTASSPGDRVDYGAIPLPPPDATSPTSRPSPNATIPIHDAHRRSISPISSRPPTAPRPPLAPRPRDRNVAPNPRPLPSAAPSPIPYSDMEVPAEAPSSARPSSPPSSVGWQASSFVPVLPDETTGLMSAVSLDSASLSGSDVLLSQSRADLERARLASTREFARRELRNGLNDRFILGCSFFFMVSIVFVIVVSGVTTILSNRNYAHLEVFSDWPNGGIIPAKYGCHAPSGRPLSIPLHWRNVPRAATNLAVLFAHPGILDKQGIDPVHWFVTDIPLNRDTDGLLANASLDPTLMPKEAKQHATPWAKNGEYWPPCVNNGTSFFVVHIYAVEASPVIEWEIRDARDIINRFKGVPVARLTGMYGKSSTLVIPRDKHEKNNDSSTDQEDSHSSETHEGDYETEAKPVKNLGHEVVPTLFGR